MSEKPVVLYKPSEIPIRKGASAFVYPVNHPNHLEGHLVSNTKLAKTSTVIDYDPCKGSFETLNTRYELAGGVDESSAVGTRQGLPGQGRNTTFTDANN